VDSAHQVSTEDDIVDRLAAAIARYVSAHPNASDTVEGVGRWWVAEEAARARTEQVEQALERLITAQRLTRRTLPDGRPVYGARVMHTDEALED
jgi:hypothetical protein